MRVIHYFDDWSLSDMIIYSAFFAFLLTLIFLSVYISIITDFAALKSLMR